MSKELIIALRHGQGSENDKFLHQTKCCSLPRRSLTKLTLRGTMVGYTNPYEVLGLKGGENIAEASFQNYY
jgi:hypothetical protein